MASKARTRTPAAERPVARVLPLLGLLQLDRLFDYRVSEADAETAQPGVRVRIRFAGRLVDGIVYERAAASDHPGELSYLDRVVSPEPVLSSEMFELVDAVARRWVGARSDVIRLAVPPRHAAAERSVPVAQERPAAPTARSDDVDQVPSGSRKNAETALAELPPEWLKYPRAALFLAAIRAGKAVRAAWTTAPGEDWAERLAELCVCVIADGRETVVIVPDQRDLDQMLKAAKRVFAEHDYALSEIVELHAGLGPQARYARWLRIRRGHTRLVIGTRSAVWAPLRANSLLIVWEDGDSSFTEPRAPYPHTREVAALRSHLSGMPLLFAGLTRTPEVAEYVESGWAPAIELPPGTVRPYLPRIVAVTDADPMQARDVAGGHTRLPTVAMTMARQALDRGEPVLVQVPRRGYIPRLSCRECRTPARCRRCSGPLHISSTDAAGVGTLTCQWCGAPDAAYTCPNCGSRRLRAGIVGQERTAEELGRMFPGVRVLAVSGSDNAAGNGKHEKTGASRSTTSTRSTRSTRSTASTASTTSVKTVTPPQGPMLVVATPGAEPVPQTRYGAALLLDAWSLLSRPDLRAAEETFRRWVAAASMVVPHDEGGAVFCSAESEVPVAQALIRWDVSGFAHRELAERREVGFPPAVHLFALDGEGRDVSALADAIAEDVEHRLQCEVEVLGPVPLPEADPLPGGDEIDEPERILLRVPSAHVWTLAGAVRAAVITRASKRLGKPVRIRLDPLYIG